MSELDRINNFAREVAERAVRSYFNGGPPPFRIFFTGFKAAQGSPFIVGQWVIYPPEGVSVESETTLYYASVPTAGLGKFTRGSELQAFKDGVAKFTGGEDRKECEEAITERLIALLDFFHDNPPEWAAVMVNEA